MGLPAQFRLRAGALCVGATLLALLATSGPVAGAPQPITGKLSKPGYTVIAVGSTSQAAVRVSGRKFRLTPPAEPATPGQGVSLHLRTPNGTYAGPIVVARKKKGRRAILGIRPGAKLGKIKVGRGYAKVSKRLRKKWVNARRLARAKRGVPIGARLFGRVRSAPPRTPIAGDVDFDGIPDRLDIDDDGDLILDSVDSSTSPPARAAQQLLDSPQVFNSIDLSLTNTVNANAGSTDAQIEQATFASATEIRLSAVFMGFPPPPAAFTELDCGTDNPNTPQPEGLSYCRRGGTGKIFRSGPMPGEDFPECCDGGPGDPPGGDGFGTLVPAGPVPNAAMALVHGATTTEIKTGDVLIKRLNDANGVELGTFSSTLEYVFATVPALVSYDDGAGNAGTVSYPVAEGAPPPGPPGGPGTSRNGFPVAPRPAGDPTAGEELVTLTLWQPQRRPIPGEPGFTVPASAWTDIGGLSYSNVVTSPHDASGMFQYKQCPQDAYSFPAGQPFTVAAPPADPGLTDTLADRPTSPNNKLTYTLNLTRCLGGLSWNSGEEVSLFTRASGRRARADTPTGYARQTYVSFKRQ